MDVLDIKKTVINKLLRLNEDVEIGIVLPVLPHTRTEFNEYVRDSIKHLQGAELMDFTPYEPHEHRQGMAVPKGADFKKAETDIFDFRFKYSYRLGSETRREEFGVVYRQPSVVPRI